MPELANPQQCRPAIFIGSINWRAASDQPAYLVCIAFDGGPE
jgi:hypothetical protein